GGLYLIYLALRYFYKPIEQNKNETKKKRSFWKVVFLIELTDLAFALDSILAGVALIGVVYHPPKLPPKIWIVYFGGMIGLILMRFAAKFFAKLIDNFPKLEKSAHLIVGFVGLKLLLESILKFVIIDIKGGSYEGLPLFGNLIFWGGIILLFVLGLISNKRCKQ
ncbi:MAG: hypothetical protein KAR79_05675, partial [Simkaniaceae bacterium]|nr:hypothetical protein [Simkaniaceae bacterium]